MSGPSDQPGLNSVQRGEIDVIGDTQRGRNSGRLLHLIRGLEADPRPLIRGRNCT
jgi:hypothetical protein